MAELDPTTMNRIRAFRDELPNDSQTAIVLDRGAPPAIVRVFAASEGYHDLANALFEMQCGSLSEELGVTGNCAIRVLYTLPLKTRQPNDDN